MHGSSLGGHVCYTTQEAASPCSSDRKLNLNITRSSISAIGGIDAAALAENAASDSWVFQRVMSAPTRPKTVGRPPNEAVDGRRGARHNAIDPLSDRATAMFIRRVLCPQTLREKNREVMTPIEEVLPPLTSRNDVDLQVYAFLAIIMKEFVQNWYNKITPDETFVAEIVHIIAHCTRALEQRLRKVDLESLVLDEIPDLLDRHITGEQLICKQHLRSRRGRLILDTVSISHKPSTNLTATSANEPASSVSFNVPLASTSSSPAGRRRCNSKGTAGK